MILKSYRIVLKISYYRAEAQVSVLYLDLFANYLLTNNTLLKQIFRDVVKLRVELF